MVGNVAFYTQTLGVLARRSQERARGLEPGLHPYTDRLVHDMGPALADDRPDFLGEPAALIAFLESL